MNYSKLICCFFLAWLFAGIQSSYSQQTEDSIKQIEILPPTQRLTFKKIDDSTELQIAAGTVRARQGNTLFTCDSCVINNRTKIFEAWGRVHINDADTADVYGDYLQYFFDKRVAFVKNHVRLTDGKTTLTTENLEYDVDTKLGIYTNGGKVIVEKKSVLTSTEGYYYTDLKDIYFKKNVELKDPAYFLKADSLLYNSETGIARFIAETFIRDSSGRTVTTSEGYYDARNRKAEFGKRSIVKDGPTTITGDRIITNDSTHISQIIGNGIIRDTVQGTTVIAGEIFLNHERESFLAFNKPLMIVKQENDSIYITADTLFSARLTDLYRSRDSVKKDTVRGIKIIDTKTKDSTNRYFEAFYHVRVFSDSLQSVCDSMFYSFKDSTFRLYKDPVLWSKESQITGDTIFLMTKNKKADRIKVFENSFLANKVQSDFFNQIKSSRMDGFFTDGSMDSVKARGFAECIYYIQDEDSAFTGVNQSTSDAIDIYFREQELKKVVFRSAVKGTLWPIRSKTAEEMRLQKFQWLEPRRPKSKYELYQ